MVSFIKTFFDIDKWSDLYYNFFDIRKEKDTVFETAKGECRDDLLNFAQTGRCPDCGNDQFYEGPSGGMNVNILCANSECGSRFNIAYHQGTLLHFERI